jgi:hypothetical protein
MHHECDLYLLQETPSTKILILQVRTTSPRKHGRRGLVLQVHESGAEN